MFHHRDHALGTQAPLGMQQRRKPDLGVNHAIFDELPEYILSDQAERILGLHEPETLRCAGKELRKVGAPCRCDVIALVLLARDGRRQAGNRLKTQRAVQVKMQLYFGEAPQFHLLRKARWWRLFHPPAYGKS